MADLARSKVMKEIVFAELPQIGDEVTAGEASGLLESTKSANDLFMPVSGEIVEVNSEVEDDPGLINSDPYGSGWLFVIKPSNLQGDLSNLLDADSYIKKAEK